MAKGFFGDFFGKIGELLQWIEQTYNSVVAQVQLILTTKQVVEQNFAQLLQELTDLTQKEAEFVDRVKHLRTSCVRADVVFEFIDEIRTGELKQFCVDQLGTMKSEVATVLDEIAAIGRGGGVLTQRGNFVLNFLSRIFKVWALIGGIVETLRGIVPVVQALKTKLLEFEKVIMQQGNPRVRLKKTISARVGKLHH